VAREHHKASETGGYGGGPEAEHETITADSEGALDRCKLRGEMVGLGPDELLDVARRRLKEHDEMVERLLRYLPRKYEKRVKALSVPRKDASTALEAVELLLGNARGALDSLAPPDREVQG
jgi:hypothetical protein